MNHRIELPRCTPEDQGISSSAILSFIHEIEKRELELHGFMFLRSGHVIAEGWWEPYKPEYPHIVNSLTKSFTSTAVGFAVQEGLINVDDLVLSYFPNITDAGILDNMGNLRIKHLLSMSTGHTEDTTRFDMRSAFLEDQAELRIGDRADRDWVRGFFEQPIQREPGTHFLYNSGASQMLAEIVQQVTGQLLVDYLYPRLFEPLGIEKPQWEISPYGKNSGGWGLKLKTEDIARFGHMILRKGMWNDQRIISEDWVRAATSKQVETQMSEANIDGDMPLDWLQGYGYQFWMCRHRAFRGDGAFGQYCLVLPDHDAVIAINSGLYDMPAVLDAVWEQLLPAMSRRAAAGEAAHWQLEQKLSALSLGESDSKIRNAMTGIRKYKIEANEDGINEISFRFGDDSSTLVWRDAAEEHSLTFCSGKWDSNNRLANEQAAVKGTWLDEVTLVIDLCRIQTPYHNRLTCVFAGHELNVKHEHLDFLPKERNLRGVLLESGE